MLNGVIRFRQYLNNADGHVGDSTSSRSMSSVHRLRLDGAEFEICSEDRQPLIHRLLVRTKSLLVGLLTPGDSPLHLSRMDAFSIKLKQNPGRWETLICNLPGDFAFVIWDAHTREVHLGRPPLSQIALYYARRDGELSFSTLAPSLARQGAFCAGRLIDLRRKVAPVLGSDRTGFADVKVVQPGTWITVGSVDSRQAPLFALTLNREKISDCATASHRLRSLFMESVERATETTVSPIATQLSGGRDSGLVSTAAASCLHRSDQRLLALTYAPELDFSGSHPRFFYDESRQAAETVRGFQNIDHQIVRPKHFKLTENLDARHAHLPMPIVAVTNLHWWDAIEVEAASAGAKRLLTGVCGNFTTSVGGPWPLNDLLREASLAQWLRRVGECRKAPGSSVPALLNMSLGGYLPKPVYNLLERVRGNEDGLPTDLFLKGDLAEARRLSSRDDDLRPSKSFRDRLLEALTLADFSDQAGPMLHGITQYDPTADRHMAQLMLDLSADLLATRYDRRPIYEAAFGDIVPQSTTRATIKGSQGADWYKVIDLQDLKSGLERYSDCRLVRQWIDIDALFRALDDWPDHAVVESPLERHFAKEVLPTISIASFLYVHS